MKLSITDRILLYELLPTHGDYKTLKATVEFRDKVVKFSRQESERFDISQERNENGFMQVTFNKEVADSSEVDVKIPLLVKAAIIEKLKSMDKLKQLREDLIPLYEKFVA